MTTMQQPSVRHLISSTTPADLWSHPTLDLFAHPNITVEPQRALLYSTPSFFGDTYDDDDRPRPTSARDLPDIRKWTMGFAVNALEIFAGRRQPAQLSTRCHRVIYMQLVAASGSVKEIGRILSIHQDQPLDGICESVITARFNERIRALALRSEGVDGRWLCTSLKLL